MADKPTHKRLQRQVEESETDLNTESGSYKNLSKSEAFLQSMFDAIQDGISVLDCDFNVIRTNRWVETLHSDKMPLVGKKCYEVYHERPSICPWCPSVMALKTGTTHSEVVPRRSADEHAAWIQLTAFPLKDGDERVVGIIEHAKDITEWKHTEEALRAAVENAEKERQRFFSILNELPGFVCLQAPDYSIRFANRYFRNQFGESEGRRCFEVIAGSEEPCEICRPIGAFETNAPIEREWSDSRTGRTYQVYNYPFTDPDSSPLVLKMGIDITKRLLAEQAMRESEQRLKTIVGSVQAGIVIIDRETHNIVDVNPHAAEMIGRPREEILGSVCNQFICPASKGECPLTDCHQTVDNSERILLKANGGEIPILKTVTPIVLGNREYLLETFIDLTEKKRLEAQLRQAQRMEAIGTLAGGIAHDFNNLLMAAQGNISLMLFDIDSTHPHFEGLKKIEEQIQSGARLTSQLLGFARKGQYEVSPADLNDLVEETLEAFGRTKKEITLHKDLAEDLFAIEADRNQIQQVLLNLCVNATDAMPAGGALSLKTRNVTHEDMKGKVYEPMPGNYVLLTIADTGSGMDKGTQERIFDPFFTTKQIGRGTGLGLPSAYGIIKTHGGYIDVDSAIGRGTSVRIYLPATEKKVFTTAKPANQITKVSETVLLVDDEEMVLEVGVRVLERLGYVVLEAKGGKEAVRAYEANQDKISLVILDMIMPEMGGGEAFDRMKKINPGVKVLLSSGYSIDGDAKDILARGCDGFIQKPFSMQELSDKIKEILNNE